MRSHRYLCAMISTAFLASCGQPNASQTQNIFGTDDRVDMVSAEKPWSAIGRLEYKSNGSNSHCTATLVATNIVLTAAHCVFSEGVMNTDFVFKPNFGRMSSEQFRRSEAEAAKGIHLWWGTKYPDSHRRDDWALVKLDRSIGSKFGWLPMYSMDAAEVPSAKLILAGYASNYRSGSTAGVAANCRIRKTLDPVASSDNEFYLHDCDSGRGSSGGSMIKKFDDGSYKIVAVNVAEYRNGGEVSLNVTGYSDDYANIGISVHAAQEKLLNILNQ